MTDITYEELMTELKKFERRERWTPEIDKAIVEARKLNVKYEDIGKVLKEKTGDNYDTSTLAKRYKQLTKNLP